MKPAHAWLACWCSLLCGEGAWEGGGDWEWRIAGVAGRPACDDGGASVRASLLTWRDLAPLDHGSLRPLRSLNTALTSAAQAQAQARRGPAQVRGSRAAPDRHGLSSCLLALLSWRPWRPGDGERQSGTEQALCRRPSACSACTTRLGWRASVRWTRWWPQVRAGGAGGACGAAAGQGYTAARRQLPPLHARRIRWLPSCPGRCCSAPPAAGREQQLMRELGADLRAGRPQAGKRAVRGRCVPQCDGPILATRCA